MKLLIKYDFWYNIFISIFWLCLVFVIVILGVTFMGDPPVNRWFFSLAFSFAIIMVALGGVLKHIEYSLKAEESLKKEKSKIKRKV